MRDAHDPNDPDDPDDPDDSPDPYAALLRPPAPGYDDATPLELASAVRRVNHVLTARLDQDLFEMGISFAQLEIMIELERDTNLHAGHLARLLAVTRQAVHGLLRQLEAGELIYLFPRDHGIRVAQLTRTGRRHLDLCRGAVGETVRALSEVTPETRNAALKALVRCERALVPRPGWYLD